jgi:AbrB family looped-hinge helix DNA binding protein
MPTATLTSKGQITLPVEVRRGLGLRQGSRVDFVPDGGGYRLEARSHLARDLAGALPKPDRPVTLDEMDQAIAAAAIAGAGL